MGKKGRAIRLTHIGRMRLIMEKDKSLDPLDVGLFGADAIVYYAQSAAYVIQKTWLAHRNRLVQLVNPFKLPILELSHGF